MISVGIILFSSSETFGGFHFLFFCVAVFVLYFLPWIVAWERHHRHELAIFWLNLLLGWCGIAWVIAFVWACTDDGRTRIKYEQ